jgi:alpha-amylase
MTNQTIVQLFHWYLPADASHWKYLLSEIPYLKASGFSMAWLPPAYKSALGKDEPGYAVYDLYDLGEFDQRGTVPTKYGSKEEYLEVVKQLKQAGIVPLADIVLNHKLGGDEEEEVPVREVDKEDRNNYLSDETRITTRSRFTFPGRGETYSNFIWNWLCFSGFEEQDRLWKIQSEYSSESWDWLLVPEKGNYNYLLGYDIEYRNPAVKQELMNWLGWLVQQTGHYGFRLDGLKHINPDFTNSLIQKIFELTDENRIIIGEYLTYKPDQLTTFLEYIDYSCQLLDFPLHKNFVTAAKEGEQFDLRKLFDGTLMQLHPQHAITYVDNHDTQPLQEEFNYVPDWFRPIAYSCILLREAGIPTVFYCDLYGASYGEEEKIELPKLDILEELLTLRRERAYGTQRDFFMNEKTIAWTREGRELGCLGVIVSYEQEDGIEIAFGAANANRRIASLSSGYSTTLQLNQEGKVWIPHTDELLQIWKAI